MENHQSPDIFRPAKEFRIVFVSPSRGDVNAARAYSAAELPNPASASDTVKAYKTFEAAYAATRGPHRFMNVRISNNVLMHPGRSHQTNRDICTGEWPSKRHVCRMGRWWSGTLRSCDRLGSILEDTLL